MPRRGSYDKFTYWTGPLITPEMKKIGREITAKQRGVNQIQPIQAGGCMCKRGGSLKKTISAIRSNVRNKQLNILRAEQADRNHLRKLANEWKSYEINRLGISKR